MFSIDRYIKACNIADRHVDDHPFRVAYFGEREDILIALLHDALEDNYSSIEEMKGFLTENEINDIIVLTRKKDETYIDYIFRVKENGGRAKRVKTVDIKVNLKRCKENGNRSLAKRYRKALEIIDS